MILLTDVISQSSNFCWIVLDETTYYISAFAVDSNGTIIDVQGGVITTDFFVPGYQQLNWIQGTGTQYINTGITPSNNTKVSISMGGWNTFQQYSNLFGARYNFSSSGRGFHLGYDNGNSKTYFAMFGRTYGTADMGGSILSFVDGNNHIIEMSQSGIYEDGTLKKSLETATFTSPGSMYIFCDNDNGTSAEFGYFKLYNFKLYNSGTLVRDFVPAMRKSDSVVGLIDMINKVFYTNSGTGTFNYG